ncbi:MAG: hypothetical protein ABR964_11580 [Tepidisphaeraceae bacterium]
MKKLRFLSSGVFLIVLAAGLGAGSGASPRPASNSPTPTSPKANSQQLTQDRSAVAAAQKDLDKANDALKPVEDKYWAVFAKTQDWIDVQDQLHKAQSDLNAARRQAVTKLTQSDDYAAAVADKQKAVAALAEAKASGDTTPETLGPLATAVMEANAKVSKMETDAQEHDPAVLDAKEKLAAVQQRADELKAQFEKSLEDKADWKPLKKGVDAAQKKLADAQATLAAHGGGS